MAATRLSSARHRDAILKLVFQTSTTADTMCVQGQFGFYKTLFQLPPPLALAGVLVAVNKQDSGRGVDAATHRVTLPILNVTLME